MGELQAEQSARNLAKKTVRAGNGKNMITETTAEQWIDRILIILAVSFFILTVIAQIWIYWTA